MSDARIRELERAARTGGPSDREALRRARDAVGLPRDELDGPWLPARLEDDHPARFMSAMLRMKATEIGHWPPRAWDDETRDAYQQALHDMLDLDAEGSDLLVRFGLLERRYVPDWAVPPSGGWFPWVDPFAEAEAALEREGDPVDLAVPRARHYGPEPR